MEWLYKSRTAYWEIENPGRRYKALRIIKNKAGEHTGHYTMDAVASRIEDMNAQTIKNIESGAPLSKDYLDKCIPLLVADLGLTMELFNTTEKIKAQKETAAPKSEKALIAKPESVQESVAKQKQEGAAKAAVKRERKPRVSTEKTVTPVQDGAVPVNSVVNHTLEPIILTIENGEIHIWDDGKDNLKKARAIWIAPADDVGRGARLMPRKTLLK